MTSMFIDPLNCGYYELNVIDPENVLMTVKIIHVPKKNNKLLWDQMILGEEARVG